MSLGLTTKERGKNGLVPSERLIQTALKLGFSQDELDELRQIYCFAMDGLDEPCVPVVGRKNVDPKSSEQNTQERKPHEYWISIYTFGSPRKNYPLL